LADIHVNGRFVTQPQSGVQRFATEVTSALLQLGGQNTRLLVPAHGAAAWPGAVEVGRSQGQVWEQWDLPRYASGGMLINLGNTAPLRARRQVVVIHDTGVFSTPEAYSSRFKLWYKLMQRFLVRRRVPVVTVSEFSRREIMQNLGASAAQISVMPEGADHLQRIARDPSVLQKHGLQPGRFVLAVGNLAAHKNLGALALLARRLPEHGMVLAVAGNLLNSAFSSPGEQLLPQVARFLGRVSDAELKALYETAACFVFPSRYEGFGLPAVEAMANGCPVVASAIPALRETCKDAAMFCDPNSPEDIADRVLQLCNDVPSQKQLRNAGAALIRGMTWKLAAEKLSAIISAKRPALS
jgi:glycosyltransferase involved in cell wall biosynthesis